MGVIGCAVDALAVLAFNVLSNPHAAQVLQVISIIYVDDTKLWGHVFKD